MTKYIRFCFFCGEGYSRDNWNENFVCAECQAIFIPPKIIKVPEIVLEAAQEAFNKIPLTDKKAVQAAKRNSRKKK